MTSSFSPNRHYELPATGDLNGTWGVHCNANFSEIDLNLSGVLGVTFPGGNTDVTLTAVQQENLTYHCTGALTGDVNLIFLAAGAPFTNGGFFIIDNQTTGAHTVSAKVAGGTAVVTGAGKTLISSDGTNLTAVGINRVVQQSFTSGGTYTPTTGMKYCRPQMVGSGAGGYTNGSGNYGGPGGGAGEYAEGIFTAADVGASKTVTIGAAGGASSDGNTTSLGSLLTAVGGKASTSPTSGLGGLGGTGGTGTGIHIPGGDGGISPLMTTAPQLGGGHGGSSYFGGGGRGGTGAVDNGQAGRAYGSGGGGNGNSGASWGTGAAGAAGFMLITEFL